MHVSRAEALRSFIKVGPYLHDCSAELSTKHTFQLQRGKGLPAQLIPYMRLCFCTDEEKLNAIDLKEAGEYTEADIPILNQLVAYLQQRLARYSLPLFTTSCVRAHDIQIYSCVQDSITRFPAVRDSECADC